MRRLAFIVMLLGCVAAHGQRHLMSHDQKFVIPENAEIGDYVGKFYTNFTDSTILNHEYGGNPYAYSLDNTYGIFTIDAVTGMITVANNASLASGNYILNVRIQEGVRNELYSASVYVAPISSSVFIDLDAADGGTGTRANPLNHVRADIENSGGWQAGTNYFIRRGTRSNNTPYADRIVVTSAMATESNPTIVAAYGQGADPVFDGNGSTSTSPCVIGNTSNSIDDVAYFEMHDIRFEDYFRYDMVKTNHTSKFIQLWRITTEGGQDNGFYAFPADYPPLNFDTEPSYQNFYDCRSYLSGEHGFKTGARNDTIINQLIDSPRQNPVDHNNSGHGLSIQAQPGTYAKYMHVTGGGTFGIEINNDSITIEDAYVEGVWYRGIRIYDDGSSYPHADPNYIRFENLYLNCQTDRIVEIATADFSYQAPNDIVFSRTVLDGGTNDGFYFRLNTNDVHINHSLIKGFDDGVFLANASNSIYFDNCTFYNNTSDFYETTTGTTFIRNSIIDNLTGGGGYSLTTNHDISTDGDPFNNAVAGDFTLNGTTSARNGGTLLSHQYDITGKTLDPAIRSIGAFDAHSYWPLPDPEPNPSDTLSLTPIADAFVRDSTYSSTNYGTQADLIVKEALNDSTDKENRREALLKFDISALDSTASSATLRLYVFDPGVGTHAAYRASSNWQETTVNWGNAPEKGLAVDAYHLVNDDDAYIEFDATKYINDAFQANESQASFLLKSFSTDYIRYYSKEGTYPPELEIIKGTPPVDSACIKLNLTHDGIGYEHPGWDAVTAADTSQLHFNDGTAAGYTARASTLTAAGEGDTVSSGLHRNALKYYLRGGGSIHLEGLSAYKTYNIHIMASVRPMGSSIIAGFRVDGQERSVAPIGNAEWVSFYGITPSKGAIEVDFFDIQGFTMANAMIITENDAPPPKVIVAGGKAIIIGGKILK